MTEGDEYNRVKLSHKRTSRGGFTLFIIGFIILILGIGEYLLASYLQVLNMSEVKLIIN